MPRHESVTDEYIAELKTGLQTEEERVKTAPNWQETQKAIVTGTNAYRIALERVEEGWSREEIETELQARTVFGKLPNPIRVVGNRRIDEEPS